MTSLNNIQHYDYNISLKLLAMLGVVINDKFDISVTCTDEQAKQKFNQATKEVFFQSVIELAPEILQINSDGELITSNKELLSKFLLDLIDSWGFKHEIFKSFFVSKINLKYPLETYPISKYEYILFAIMESSRNKNFIKDISFSYDNNFDNFNLENPNNIIRHIGFKITVDVTTLFRIGSINQLKSKTNNRSNIKVTKFNPQQYEMYNQLKNYVRKYNYTKLYKFDLLQMFKFKGENKEKRLNTAINRLNSQFCKIHGADIELIKCIDRYSGYYEIQDVWGIKKNQE